MAVSISLEGARQPHIMIVGASSAGSLSVIVIAKSSFMGVPHLNQLSVFLFSLLFVLGDGVMVSMLAQTLKTYNKKYNTKLFNAIMCNRKQSKQ